MKPSWWFCCGWWSPWCVIDTLLHAIRMPIGYVCERHDNAITSVYAAELEIADAELARGEGRQFDNAEAAVWWLKHGDQS